MTFRSTPRLYLDIDGVILAKQPKFKDAEDYDFARYSPEVARRIGQTGLELVWLTTWGERDIEKFTDDIDELKGGRYLHRPIGLKKWKIIALESDQLNSPSPFVWIEDQMDPEDVNRIKGEFYQDHLLISPDPSKGLSNKALKRIELFASSLINQ
jgi:hypothetical protein